jgi:hypothetical protein
MVYLYHSRRCYLRASCSLAACVRRFFDTFMFLKGLTRNVLVFTSASILASCGGVQVHDSSCVGRELLMCGWYHISLAVQHRFAAQLVQQTATAR